MNDKNLIPQAHVLTVEEQSRGGKKSVVARKRKRGMIEAMKALLSADVADTDIYNSAAEMGISPEDMNYQNAIIAAMVRNAANGDTRAFHEIREMIGADTFEKERLAIAKKELKIKEAQDKRLAKNENAPVTLNIDFGDSDES